MLAQVRWERLTSRRRQDDKGRLCDENRRVVVRVLQMNKASRGYLSTSVAIAAQRRPRNGGFVVGKIGNPTRLLP